MQQSPFLILVFGGGILGLIAAWLFYAALQGGLFLILPLVGAAWGFCVYKDRIRKSRSK